MLTAADGYRRGNLISISDYLKIEGQIALVIFVTFATFGQ